MTLEVPTYTFALPEGVDPPALVSFLATRFDIVAEPPTSVTYTVLDTADRRLGRRGLDLALEAGRRRADAGPADRAGSAPLSAGARPAPRAGSSRDLPAGPAARPPGAGHRDAGAAAAGRRAGRGPAAAGAQRRRQDRRPPARWPPTRRWTRGGERGAAHAPGRGQRRARLPEAAGPGGRRCRPDRGGPGRRPGQHGRRGHRRRRGAIPAGIRTKVRVELRPDERTDRAAVAVLCDLAGMVEANLPGTLADLDTEFLHDLRVAVRRSRSVLRELKGAFPPEPLATPARRPPVDPGDHGPTRDLDVQLLDWDHLLSGCPPTATPPWRPCARCWSATAPRRSGRCRRELRGPTYRQRLGRLPRIPRRRAGTGRRAPRRQAADRRRGRPRGSARSTGGWWRWAPRSTTTSPAEDLHELRKRGKELRYLLELFGGLWPGDVVKPMVRTLKGLQDVLGSHQDREVQADHLRGLADELAGETGGPEALLALGVLVDRLDAEQHEARDAVRRALRRLRRRRPARRWCAKVVLGEGRRHLQHQGRRGEDIGGGQPGGAGGAATGCARCCGTSTRRARRRSCSGCKPKVRGGGRKLVRGRSDVAELLRGTDVEGLDLLPADFSYRHMDLVLDDAGKPTRRLRKVLAPLADHYDLAVLDCPPSISLVSESVFDAADALLVPLIPSTLTLRTFDQLGDFVADEVDRRPQIVAFFSMVDRPQAAAPRGGRDAARRAATTSPHRHPGRHRGRADGRAPRAGRGRRAPQPAARAYVALWAELRGRLKI